MGTNERQRERARLIEMFAVEIIRGGDSMLGNTPLVKINGPEALVVVAAELADALLERAWGPQ